MFNASTLKTGLRNLVGFRQSLDPQQVQLNELITSDSGLYFQSGHPEITIEVLKALAINDQPFTYSAWDIGTAYVVGDIVSNGGVNYIAIQAGTGNLVSDTNYWKVYLPFEETLKGWVDDAIIGMMNDWSSKKVEMRTAVNLLEREQLIRITDFDDVARSESNFCGLKIRTLDSNTVKYKLHKVGLIFSTAATVTVKIFKQGEVAAIHSEIFTLSAAKNLEWFEFNTAIELEAKTVYYVGYYPDGKEYYELLYNDEIKPNKFFDVVGFRKADGGDPTAIWNSRTDEESYSKSYGVNLKMSAYCDYTELILEQKLLFASALNKRFAIDTLKRIIHNPEANVNRHLKSKDVNFLVFELQGNNDLNENSLISQYKKELEAIMFDTHKIDKACLHCAGKGVKYRVV